MGNIISNNQETSRQPLSKRKISFWLSSFIVFIFGALVGGIGSKIFDIIFTSQIYENKEEKYNYIKSTPQLTPSTPIKPPPIGSIFTYEITYTKEGIDLGGVVARPGDVLKFKINNQDIKPHDFTIDLLNITSNKILPQQNAIVEVSIPKVSTTTVYQWRSTLDKDNLRYTGAIIVIPQK